MKYLDILKAFELEINTLDKVLAKPAVEDSLFWLNLAVGKFIKSRFIGNNITGQGFEQNEKRREDLIRLFVIKEYSNIDVDNTQATYDKYTIKYPQDFLFVLNEDVVISDENDEHLFDTCMFECTRDSYMYRITNSLTDFHYKYHRARPLRIRNAEGCDLLTDKNYKVYKYSLGYLRKPTEITLQNPFDEYSDFEDSILNEIIKIAAQMYLENQGSQRYQTISSEVLTQE